MVAEGTAVEGTVEGTAAEDMASEEAEGMAVRKYEKLS